MDSRWWPSYSLIFDRQGWVLGRYRVFGWPAGRIRSADFMNGLYGISAERTFRIQQISERSVNKQPLPFLLAILSRTHPIFFAAGLPAHSS